MNQLSGLMDNIMAVQIIDIVIAVSIVILFRIFSSSLSYICIKMFKFKTRNKKKIKESAFYNPLRVFISLLGVYIAIAFLRQPLKISDEVIGFVTKAFQIISVIIFAKGLAASLTPNKFFAVSCAANVTITPLIPSPATNPFKLIPNNVIAINPAIM